MGRDVELHLEKIHGPSSWEARLDKTWYAPHSETVLFRTRADSSFEQGDVLRALDVHITPPADPTGAGEWAPTIITMGARSEAFAATSRPTADFE